MPIRTHPFLTLSVGQTFLALVSSFHFLLKVNTRLSEPSFLFGVPVVFALSIFNWRAYKEVLIHTRRGSEAVAGRLEVAIFATTFRDVAHCLLVLSYHLRYIDAATAIR